MEKVAAKLAGLLVERQVIEDSMYDIYHYGMLRMLEIGAAFFSSLLICLSMGMIKEGLLFLAFLFRFVLIWAVCIAKNAGNVIWHLA